MSLTSNRSTKGAYFSDTKGGNIIDFQFSPETLEFNEGGRFSDRVLTGRYNVDYIWISGQPTKMSIKMWVDRTLESVTPTDATQDPFGDVVRFPKATIPRYANFDIVNMVRGMKNGIMDRINGNVKNKQLQSKTPIPIDPSVFAVSPNFDQSTTTSNKGVFHDVEKLAYFIRPLGYEQGVATTNSEGVISISDYKHNRFTPPPKCRYFYGNFWAEGYIQEVSYKLSVMNENLVPLRMEADIEFIVTDKGYLNDIAGSVTSPNTEVINA